MTNEVIINDPKPPFLTEARRAYFYRLSAALLLVAQALRWIDDVDVYVNVASAVLGITNAGLAAANTSTHQ